ncbi:PHB depolymerase family esterase [Limibacter armeniacum]|uniref:extracellular catalytic domain type 1 short-chain-length polyhydroxyalkanoate depolymerase n=1 Tax=Limibacter armeniacum TaxID=466084 RepID=UPI002FE6523B
MNRLNHSLLLVVSMLFLYTTANAQLTQVSSFGSNPGNLTMYYHAPSGIGSNVAVVVVMHGCSQTASGYAAESGWNVLADTYGFYVVYPEQKSANNSSTCFNWFETGDIARGQGEALSIKNMVTYMVNTFGVDSDRAFVTGFSAGGGMTNVMLAAYPDVFASGAVMAGIPYKSGTGLTGAFQAMNPGNDKTPLQWGNLVRNASSNSGDWPTVAVFHGTSDYTVNSMNLLETVEQWVNVHDQTIQSASQVIASSSQNDFNGATGVTRKGYSVGGQEIVVSYSISGMGHAISIDPGSGTGQGGQTGSYAVDKDLYSSYWAAVFFGLTGAVTPPPTADLNVPTGVTAIATSSSAIDISWTDTNTDEAGYVVERASSSGGPFSEITSLAANTVSYTDEGLTAETTYYYRVAAEDADGEKVYGTVVSATTDSDGNGGGSTTETYAIEQLLGPYFFAQLATSDCGQSFTTISAGTLESIEVKLKSAISNTTLKIFSGSTISGTPIYTQTGVSAGSGLQTITLTAPPALDANSSYTFFLENASLGVNYTNVYSGGSFFCDNVNYAYYDAYFVISIAEASGARWAAQTIKPQVDWYLDSKHVLRFGAESSGVLTLIGLDGKMLMRKPVSSDKITVPNIVQGLVIGIWETDSGVQRKKLLFR